MLNTETAKKLLGQTGEKLTNKQIDNLSKQLYTIISQLLDNNIKFSQSCEKQ